MKEIRVKVNKIELQIRDNEKDGEPIIFLHYGGSNLMMWEPIVPYFQEKYRIILVDLRGHGKSDIPETGYHIDEMSSDIIGVMHYLKLEKAHIVGSSLGAEVGISLAANYPEKAISVICEGATYSEYGPFGIWEGSLEKFEEHVSSQQEKRIKSEDPIYPSIEALVNNNRASFEDSGLWNQYTEAIERYSARKIGDGQYSDGMGKKQWVDYMSHYWFYRFEDYYRKISCPILLLPAEEEVKNDRNRSVLSGLQELTKQGTVVEISGWEHAYGWLSNPEVASKITLNFLSNITE